jgi:glycosyltransferase involved in cell wall biosynthesis
MMQNPISVSIILPCYNPGEGWSNAVIERLTKLTERLPDYRLQFIVSNDGSSKICPREIASLTQISTIVFLTNSINQGKGSAIRRGVAQAEGDIIIYTDIDFPFGIEPIINIIKLLEQDNGCQFVFGKRVPSYFSQLPLKRRIISKAIRIINQVMISPFITDTQAGIKGLRRELAGEILEIKTNTFVFEIELMRKLIKKGIAIQSIDVTPEERIVFSDFSSKTLIRESINLFKILFDPAWQSIQ